MRHYICQIVGTGGPGLEDAFRPVVDALLDIPWNAVDGRTDSTLTGGWMLVSCNPTNAEHLLLAADPRVHYLPFENLATEALELEATLGDIPLTQRRTLLDLYEAEHIPVHDLTTSNTVRDAMKRLIRRCVLRQKLKILDYFEGLDTLVSEIPASRRNAIRNRLLELGFDISVVSSSNTIREAIRKILIQAVRANQTYLDG